MRFSQKKSAETSELSAHGCAICCRCSPRGLNQPLVSCPRAHRGRGERGPRQGAGRPPSGPAKAATPSTFGSCTGRTCCGRDCGLIGLGPGIMNLRATLGPYGSTEWKDIRQRVPITWTECHLGGRRPGSAARSTPTGGIVDGGLQRFTMLAICLRVGAAVA
jgi:hypothetical protein